MLFYGHQPCWDSKTAGSDEGDPEGPRGSGEFGPRRVAGAPEDRRLRVGLRRRELDLFVSVALWLCGSGL